MGHVPRIYVAGRLGPGSLLLEPEPARRLASVMRIREGERFLVFSGDGREWEATVKAAGKSMLQAEVGELTRQEPPLPLVVELWCALVRPNRLDWAIEKCTEAGADIIRPVLCEHSARGEGGSAARAERWERIAIEAAEQCGRLRIPVVEPPRQFEALISHPPGPVFIADREGRPWREARSLLPEAGRVVLAIGPEGGFSDAERHRARSAGAVSVALGPNILRTETAALAAVTLVRAG